MSPIVFPRPSASSNCEAPIASVENFLTLSSVDCSAGITARDVATTATATFNTNSSSLYFTTIYNP